MQLELNWKEGMAFEAKAGSNLIPMDAKTPIGRNTAATPKELVAAGLAGCTAMDVIALMRKYKQEVTHFSTKVDITTMDKGHPTVFTAAKINFYLEGKVDPAKAVEAVHLSQTQYCGVSAMLAKAFPITWEVFVNGESVGTGQAQF
jgi:putative redox protein